MTTPNRTKELLDALKTKNVKATKKGKRSIIVGKTTVAHVYEGANGAIRVYVFTEKLPAKLAEKFKLTESSGYAQRFAAEDKLAPAVDAIAHAAKSVAAAEESAEK